MICRNSLTFIAQPLEKGIAEAIETKAISLSQPVKEVSQFFQGNFGWDILAARSIWAFGPTDHSPNILLNDTLPTEVDKKALNSIRDGLTQGFQWACREGPLCDERKIRKASYLEKWLMFSLHSDAQRQIQYLTCNYCERADIQRRWADNTYSTSCLLFFIPDSDTSSNGTDQCGRGAGTC